MIACLAASLAFGHLPQGNAETAPPPAMIVLPVQFIQIADDAGRVDMYLGKAPLNAETIAGIFDEANRKLLNPIGIHLAFDPQRSFSLVRNTNLYLGRDTRLTYNLEDKSQKPPSWDDTTIYESMVESSRPAFTFIARRGTNWEWNDQRGRWASTGNHGIGHPKYACVVVYEARHWVHELGHVIGLPHSYIDVGAKDVPALQRSIDEFRLRFPGRNPLECFDGDVAHGILDTAPDPGFAFWRKGYYEDTVRLNLDGQGARDMFITKTNIMSSNGGEFISKDQAEVLRAGAAFWARSGGRLPTNTPPQDSEFRLASLENVKAPKGVALRKGRQFRFSGGREHVEATLAVGQTLSFLFQPPRPGRYRVSFLGTRGIGHARCELSVENGPDRTEDFWCSPSGSVGSPLRYRLPTGTIYVGDVEAKGKPLELRIKVVGKHRMSFGTTVGIEGVVLQRIES